MVTTSDQFRPAGRGSDRRLGRRVSNRRLGRRVRDAACLAAVAAGLACGDSGGDPAERADLERRFGRPADQSAPPAGAGELGEGRAEAGGAGDEAEAGSVARDASDPPAGEDARSPRPTDRPTAARPPAAPAARGGREGPATAEASPGEATPTEEPALPATRPDEPRPAGGGAAGGAAAPQEIDLTALLAEAERAYASLSSLRASFVQLMEVPLLERSSTGRGTWYQKGRDRFRMDFEDPPNDEIVADGTHLWLFQPSVQPHQVIRSTLADGVSDSGTPDLLARILSQARTAYRSRYEGRESVAGVRTHQIALVPTGRSQYREVRVWIGDDRLVRRFQILEENESRRTVTLSGLEPNVPLADSLFRFTPPPGVDVFDG